MALFELGTIVLTQGTAELNQKNSVIPYLKRHVNGDWTEMDKFDQEQNAYAVEIGERIFSAYDTPEGKIWIITESDRSCTTVLLPEEY